jgi:hypothetical protein
MQFCAALLTPRSFGGVTGWMRLRGCSESNDTPLLDGYTRVRKGGLRYKTG